MLGDMVSGVWSDDLICYKWVRTSFECRLDIGRVGEGHLCGTREPLPPSFTWGPPPKKDILRALKIWQSVDCTRHKRVAVLPRQMLLCHYYQDWATSGETSTDCLLLCSICDPQIQVSAGPPLLWTSFCNSVFAACSDAYFSADPIHQVPKVFLTLKSLLYFCLSILYHLLGEMQIALDICVMGPKSPKNLGVYFMMEDIMCMWRTSKSKRVREAYFRSGSHAMKRM